MQEGELPDLNKEYFMEYWARPATTMVKVTVVWLILAIAGIFAVTATNLDSAMFLHQIGISTILLFTSVVIPPAAAGALMQRRQGLRPEMPFAVALGPLVGGGGIVQSTWVVKYLVMVAAFALLGALLAAGAARTRERLAGP